MEADVVERGRALGEHVRVEPELHVADGVGAVVHDAQARVAADPPRVGIERHVEIRRRPDGGGLRDGGGGEIGPGGRREPGRGRERGRQRERDRFRPCQGAGSGPRPGAVIAVDAAASPTPRSSP